MLCYTMVVGRGITLTTDNIFYILQQTTYITRGVCSSAISKRFDTIVEFTTFEDFISFEKKVKNKVKRIENHKIKVTIEVDMVCEAV